MIDENSGMDFVISNFIRRKTGKKKKPSEKETLDLLRKKKAEKDFSILIHCFTGSKKFAYRLLDLGAYISASGVVTFKKSQELANTFRDIPNDRILVETDAPYLAPVPLRGKSNEPSFLKYTLEKIAEIKNNTVENMDKITTDNFNNLFSVK